MRAFLLIAFCTVLLSARFNAAVASDWPTCANLVPTKTGVEATISACTRIIERRGDDRAVAFNNRGNAFLLLGDYDSAIADYDEAIRLSREYAAAYNNRGTAYLQKENIENALEDFERAVFYKPDFAVAYSNLGVAFARKGNFARSISEFNRAIRLSAKFAAPYANRGRSYLKLEELDRAVSDLETALQLQPNIGDWVEAALAEARAAKLAMANRSTVETGRRVAMIFGNGKYPSIGNLKNAENDAIRITEALSARGFDIIGPNGTAKPFVNLTKPQMDTALETFERQAANSDVALIWYAGHGSSFRIGDRQRDNFLLPVDFQIGDAPNIVAKGVTVERLKRAVFPSSKLRVLIIDACRDNNIETPTRGLKRGLLPEARNKDMIVMFSTQSGNEAEDGEGDLSPFAEGFLEELDANPRAFVLTFLTAVSGRVKAKTRSTQIPEIFSNVTDSNLVLVN